MEEGEFDVFGEEVEAEEPAFVLTLTSKLGEGRVLYDGFPDVRHGGSDELVEAVVHAAFAVLPRVRSSLKQFRGLPCGKTPVPLCLVPPVARCSQPPRQRVALNFTGAFPCLEAPRRCLNP